MAAIAPALGMILIIVVILKLARRSAYKAKPVAKV